jgi:hypothetical protein
MSETVEFSRLVTLDEVPPLGIELRFEATEEERNALARRFGLLGLSNFSGTARLKPWRRVGFALEAHFQASVTQACVVSMEPVEGRVDENFQLFFLPADVLEERQGEEIIVEADNPQDAPEPLPERELDVGEVVAEQLALAIDPYPRRAGIVFEPPKNAADSSLKPFAGLEALKKDK